MGGPETRSATRCDGRSVFARVAKPVVEAGKRFFHRLTAAILTRSYQLSEVLKKAQQNTILRYTRGNYEISGLEFPLEH